MPAFLIRASETLLWSDKAELVGWAFGISYTGDFELRRLLAAAQFVLNYGARVFFFFAQDALCGSASSPYTLLCTLSSLKEGRIRHRSAALCSDKKKTFSAMWRGDFKGKWPALALPFSDPLYWRETPLISLPCSAGVRARWSQAY